MFFVSEINSINNSTLHVGMKGFSNKFYEPVYTPWSLDGMWLYPVRLFAIIFPVFWGIISPLVGNSNAEEREKIFFNDCMIYR